jgi:sporulation protein YlmC with PRC-barrel domain
MPVVAADGQKVGEVGELSFAVETGSPSRLTVRTGHLLKHQTELPVAWIRDLSTRGVLLNASTSKVEAWIKSGSNATQ